MLQSVAKLAVTLNLDGMANSLVERCYTNRRSVSPHFSRRFQILGYHKVSHDPHPSFEPLHPEVFERQMQFLKSCYRVMSLQELVERSTRGEVPQRAVAITFDDGYRDNYDYAFPILKKYQFPATIFVATGAIGTGNRIWHDVVFDAFRFATVDRARLQDDAIPELVLETPEARQRSLEATLARAKTLYGEGRRNFIEDLEAKLCPNLPPDIHARMLNWDHVREMHTAGIEFGSHTVSHTILSHIPRSEMVKELLDSKRELSERLGTGISSFAYPNGKSTDYNSEAKTVLRECGYSSAVTCCTGFNHVSSDLFELKRGLPWQRDIEVFRFKFFLQRHGLVS